MNILSDELSKISLNDSNNTNSNTSLDIRNMEGLKYLETIPNKSIDLILTDPPYIISRETGMNHYNNVKFNDENNIHAVKTEEWVAHKIENDIQDDANKNNYLKYGTIYGKKYCVKTDYGDWDINLIWID